MGGTVGKYVRARARITTIFKWEHGCVSSPTFRRTGAGVGKARRRVVLYAKRLQRSEEGAEEVRTCVRVWSQGRRHLTLHSTLQIRGRDFLKYVCFI